MTDNESRNVRTFRARSLRLSGLLPEIHGKIASYLSATELLASLSASDESVGSMLNGIRSSAGFSSLTKAIEDVVRYNEPELYAAMNSEPSRVTQEVTRSICLWV